MKTLLEAMNFPTTFSIRFKFEFLLQCTLLRSMVNLRISFKGRTGLRLRDPLALPLCDVYGNVNSDALQSQ